MVIFIAGLIGTGKTSLARSLSKELNIYYYDVDLVKKVVYPTDPDYEYNLKNNIPFSDKTRTKVFNQVVRDFSKLAKKHKYIIVDETLHKKSTRQVLFNGATKYFGSYIIVLIKANEKNIKKRLEKNKRIGHLLKNPFNMYLSFKNKFEAFDKVDIIFENNKNLGESTKKLSKLIKEKL